jgi:Fis family transcriptional regulator
MREKINRSVMGDCGSLVGENHKGLLCHNIEECLNSYFRDLNGHQPTQLYDLVLCEVERPLLEVVLRHTDGNLTKSASILGLNRATLRKKLKQHGILADEPAVLG